MSSRDLIGHRVDFGTAGFIQLLDVMGEESAITEAARTSYGAGTKSVSEDRTLLRYLMRHRHSTPVEMVEIKFLIQLPMDTNRQHIRHRMASVNEYSTRYSIAIDDIAETLPGEWRYQATDNKQGSSGEFTEEDGRYLTKREKDFHDFAREIYKERIDKGVAREQARKDLPLSTYTRLVWKIDLHNLLHYLGLRMDSHAQKEIREMATIIGEEFIAKMYPNVWKAFLHYRFNATSLSELDQLVVTHLRDYSNLQQLCESREELLEQGWDKPRCRERDECVAKLLKMRLVRVQSNDKKSVIWSV